MVALLLLLLQEHKVAVTKDVFYVDGKDRHEKKHRLDLFVPDGKGPFPVLMFIHGGAWEMGDKALYGHVGEAFARRGIVTAVVSYRLSPEVKHPAHIQDVARAFAWLKKNAKNYSGDPDRIFVTGQSAGGHLTALLALNEKYLKEVGLKLSDIAGAIPISGVYRLGAKAFPDVFPEDSREDAEPARFVGKDKPPFLVMWGDDDPLNLRLMGRSFARQLEGAKSLEVKDRTHITIVTKIGSPKDELTEAIAAFVLKK